MEWKSRFNGPKESSGFLLWQVTQAWQRMITKELNKIDLTHVQFVLLAACDYLHTTGEAVTQKALAEFTNSNSMMVSDVVRTLEAKGYITRNKNPQDKREILLTPTDKGATKIKVALPIVEAIDVQFFASIQDHQPAFNETLLSLLSCHTQVDE